MKFQLLFAILLSFLVLKSSLAQTDRDSVMINSSQVANGIHFLYCVNGFGGGNVLASVGTDGILLVDNMYSWMGTKLDHHLKTLSPNPVRIIINTHFHRDHIDGNKNFQQRSVFIAHENVNKRLAKNNSTENPTLKLMPTVTFPDMMSVHFNGEGIQLIHFAGHTDGDVAVFFPKSNVLHLGDMFFFGMFPAVYTQGGGDIKQLIQSLDKILKEFPKDAQVVPGHGTLATMKDLQNYVDMLKETTSLVETAIKNGLTLEKMKADKILSKFDTLGDGGAQTTDQYLTMLYNLLITKTDR